MPPGPPLLSLTAVSAVAAMVINRLLLIFLDGRIGSSSLLQLSRWGQLTTTLATLAALVAFVGALFSSANRSSQISLRRRMVMGGLTGILVFAVARSVVIPRERATAAILWIATGAAYILIVYVAMEGARWARRPVSRLVAIAAASMAILALGALVLERFNQYQLGGWQLVMVEQLQRAGEAGYLAVLISATAFALNWPRSRRDWFGHAVALLTFASTCGLCVWALLNLRGDVALVIAYALRGSWFIDRFPAVYLVVVCAAGSAALAASISSDSAKKAVALGIILLVCSGYAPRSPDRLLIYVLAVLQLARGVIINASRHRSPA